MNICLHEHSFVHELGIHVEHSEKQTFFHHSGASTSQIDFILSLNDKTLKDYRVHDQSAKNLSSHVPVSATLNTNIESKTKPGKNTSKSIKKCNWKKADIEGFQKTPEDELYKLELTESGTVNDNLTSLMVLLLKSLTKLPNYGIIIEISQQPENCENRNDPDLVQAFLI